MVICKKCKETLNEQTYEDFWESHQTIPNSHNYGDFDIWCIKKL
jgi:hypothetical protein